MIEKHLSKLTKEWGENIHINKIRNENGDVRDREDIQ